MMVLPVSAGLNLHTIAIRSLSVIVLPVSAGLNLGSVMPRGGCRPVLPVSAGLNPSWSNMNKE